MKQAEKGAFKASAKSESQRTPGLERRGFFCFKDPFFLSVAFLFVLFAASWSVLLPVHEAPDEQNHYRYMVFVKDQHRLPRQLPLPPEVAGEGHQAPLYYWLGAAVLKVVDPKAAWVELPNQADVAFNRQPVYFKHYAEAEGFLRFSGYARGPHLVRMALLPLGLASLALTWYFLCMGGAAISPGARAAFALLALNPAWLALNGALNNDHLLTFFFTLAVCLMVRVRGDATWTARNSLWLGLVLGLGMLSKVSMACLVPVGLACAWRGSAPVDRPKNCLKLLLAGAAVCGWFLLRNRMLYGDLLGWKMHLLTCPGTVHVKSALDLAWWRFWFSRMFGSYWAVFGWYTWSAPGWVLPLFQVLTGAAVVGLAAKARRLAKDPVAWILLFSLGGLAGGMASFNLTFDPPEGRYLYAALIPVAAAFSSGLGWWLERLPARGAALAPLVLAAGLVLLNGWVILYGLVPAYYNF